MDCSFLEISSKVGNCIPADIIYGAASKKVTTGYAHPIMLQCDSTSTINLKFNQNSNLVSIINLLKSK